MAFPILTNGSGIWTKRRGAKIETTKTKSSRRAAGYTRKNQIRNIKLGKE
jgi:hypothetical protein